MPDFVQSFTAATATQAITLSAARLADIAPALKLITGGSRQGHFSPRYLEPRYRTGLALQLVSVLLFGRLRLPNKITCKARLQSVYADGMFAGFMLVQESAPAAREIYMMAVAPAFRGQGLGRHLVQALQAESGPGCLIAADCLPASITMKALLLKLGFRQDFESAAGAALHFSYRR